MVCSAQVLFYRLYAIVFGLSLSMHVCCHTMLIGGRHSVRSLLVFAKLNVAENEHAALFLAIKRSFRIGELFWSFVWQFVTPLVTIRITPEIQQILWAFVVHGR